MTDETIARVAKAILDEMDITDAASAERYAIAAIDEIQKIGNELLEAYGITGKLATRN